MNSLLQPFVFTCPWCWEQNESVADLTSEQQEYIEDCRVCCHPIQISFAVADGELSNLHTERAM